MKRRTFLQKVGLTASTAFIPTTLVLATETQGGPGPGPKLDADVSKDWLARWEKSILSKSRDRYCDRESGEEIGWLISPFLDGFYYGFQTTGDHRWVERLVDWADSWIQRGVKEPDGFIGWPKGGSGGAVERDFYTDSLLGEAMALRPVVLMADEILRSPVLTTKFGAKAEAYLKLADETFQKWIARGCWREVKDGGVWVVPAFGIDRQNGKWTDGYSRRNTEGFSHPANKQNLIARWLTAMHEVTKKPVFQEHARKWWQVMKSRVRTHHGGKYVVWNYWDPAGPWDFKPAGSPRHRVGVHPNGGYYETDVAGIVAAFEHGLVFTMEDIQRLIATNRDFMWNHQLAGARFERIDGGVPDPRWKDSPGTLWTALVLYDETLKRIFLATHDPASWGGLSLTPWFLAHDVQERTKAEGETRH